MSCSATCHDFTGVWTNTQEEIRPNYSNITATFYVYPDFKATVSYSQNPILAVSAGYAYVVDTGSDDLKVSDVSDPAAPALAGAVSGNYAYVVDGPGGNLLAVELSCLLPVAIDPSTGSLVEGNFQNLSISGTALSISGGNSVSLAGVQDNLGNHTATQNIRLNNSWLSNDGGNEGFLSMPQAMSVSGLPCLARNSM